MENIKTAVDLALFPLSVRLSLIAPRLMNGLPEDAEDAAKSYLEDHGLEKITDLPSETIDTLKSSLIKNYDDKGAFLKDALYLGIPQDRADLIFDNETHDADGHGEQIAAKQAGAKTKTWHSSGEMNMCEVCAGMDGETVPIDEPFSNGEYVAHYYPGCNCDMSFGF